jgi:hypothetical protein
MSLARIPQCLWRGYRRGGQSPVLKPILGSPTGFLWPHRHASGLAHGGPSSATLPDVRWQDRSGFVQPPKVLPMSSLLQRVGFAALLVLATVARADDWRQVHHDSSRQGRSAERFAGRTSCGGSRNSREKLWRPAWKQSWLGTEWPSAHAGDAVVHGSQRRESDLETLSERANPAQPGMLG